MSYGRGMRMARGWKIPSTRKLHEMVDKFLAEHKESDHSGFAPVTDAEVEQLGEIIRLLICRKYRADADGDVPVEFELIDCTKEYDPGFDPVPYTHGEDVTPEDYLNALRKAAYNLSVAVSDHDRAFRIYDDVLRDEKKKEAEHGH